MKKIMCVPDNNPGKLMESSHAIIDELYNGMTVALPVTIALRRALGHQTIINSESRRPVQPTHSIDILSGWCEQFA